MLVLKYLTLVGHLNIVWSVILQGTLVGHIESVILYCLNNNKRWKGQIERQNGWTDGKKFECYLSLQQTKYIGDSNLQNERREFGPPD